jgi:hypothetical protein
MSQHIETVAEVLPAGTSGPTLASRLAALELVIERGKQTFIQVGAALTEIKDQRLYRDQFNTFEDYCRERWGFGRQTAYDYLKASQVYENVRSSVQIPPSFTQARELAALEPEQQREIASTTNFANNTVAEIKEKVKQIRQPAKKQERRADWLGRRRAAKEKLLKKEMISHIKAYNRATFMRAESVEVTYDLQGKIADVQIVHAGDQKGVPLEL